MSDMFGKKTIPINEFGFGVLRYADDFITSDAGRSLGTQFENWDGSRGWWNFLQSRGVSKDALRLYQTLYTHCVLQTVFKCFSTAHRWEMLHGAISNIANLPEGYHLEEVFSELEAAFEGKFKLSKRVEPLESDSLLHFMAYPRVGILASKYLVEKFVLNHMEKRDAFITDFKLFSSTFGSSVGTAKRAMDQITAKFKIEPQQTPPSIPQEYRPQSVLDPATKPTDPVSPFAWTKEKEKTEAKPKKNWEGFQINDEILYRAIGPGQIVDVEIFDALEGEIERFVIEFPDDEAELRVPVLKLREMLERESDVISEEDSEKSDTPILESNGFKVGEHVVYPEHGVGKITGIERAEIAGAKLLLFVIHFKNSNMTLRVPTDKSKGVGMRRLADEI